MNPEFLQEAKNFRRQIKWCALMCAVATLIIVGIAKEDALKADLSWLIIPAGGIIFALIYFNMDKNIKKYENETPGRNSQK